MEKFIDAVVNADVSEVGGEKGKSIAVFCMIGNAPVIQTGFSSKDDAQVAIGFAQKILSAIQSQTQPTVDD